MSELHPRTRTLTRHTRRFAWAVAALLTAAAPTAALAAPSGLAPGLSLIERQYLFSTELDPERLLHEALKSFERNVADLFVTRADERSWILVTPDCELHIELAAEAEVRALEAPLGQVGRFLGACSRRLPPAMPAMDAFLLGGVLAALDPYSTIFDEKRHTEHNIQFQGRLAGIGARIGTRDDSLFLLNVYPGSPADRAGLRDGDEVLRIDDLSTRNLLVTDAVQRIRGEAGTEVSLLVRSKAQTATRTVKVTRGMVTIPSVTSRMLSGDVLLAEISQFSQTTPGEFRRQMEDAIDDVNLRGVVIDLRRNSGGSMMGASAIGDLFLREGLLITTAGRDGKPARGLTSEVRASGQAPFADVPLAFLTSPTTASGSELLAASLRNNDRALLLGEHTFGKGTVQKTFPLHDSSTMKITVGHFLPDGRPIPGGGLVPDIEVLTFRVGGERLAIPFPARRSDVPFWLRHPSWAKEEERAPAFRMAFAEDFPESDVVDEDEGGAPEAAPEAEPDDIDKLDRTLEIAAAVLRNHGQPSATAMLEAASDFLAATTGAANTDLAEFMHARGLDWTDGPRSPSEPRFRLEVLPATRLRAGDRTSVEIRLTNLSDAPFYRVRGLLESSGGGLDRRPVAFGRIEPGATRSWRLTARTPSTARTGRVRVAAVLFDDDGEFMRVDPVLLVVEEKARPHLAVRVHVSENADDPTVLDLRLDIQNRGVGEARNVFTRVSHPPDAPFEVLEGSARVESLDPGATATVTLRVRPAGSFEEVPMAELSISETAHAIFFEPKVALEPTGDGDPPWRMPPRIAIEGFMEVAGGGYEVILTANDDVAIDHMRVRVDEDAVAYVEPEGEESASARVRIPWDSTGEVRHLRVEATDAEGLRDFYSGGF